MVKARDELLFIIESQQLHLWDVCQVEINRNYPLMTYILNLWKKCTVGMFNTQIFTQILSDGTLLCQTQAKSAQQHSCIRCYTA